MFIAKWAFQKARFLRVEAVQIDFEVKNECTGTMFICSLCKKSIGFVLIMLSPFSP